MIPYDGEVIYFGPILNGAEADRYFETLLSEVPWRNDEVRIYGKHVITQRKTAWFGEDAYTYSGITRAPLPWTRPLLELKEHVESVSLESFNACLMNLYQSGREGMGWHSDDEASLGRNPVIASVSLGAERKFSLKHKKTKETVSITLENGGLLLMKGSTQACWLHALPKSTRVAAPRINLTFRKIV